MGDIKIVTDSSADLPYEWVNEANIDFLSLKLLFNDEEHVDDFGQTLQYKLFYDAIRNGGMSQTSQATVQEFVSLFSALIKKEKKIIYIGFSSGLSGTINSATIAKDIVLNDFPEADISIIDTKCASLGQGLLVYKAVELLKEGCSKEEIVNWIETHKLKMNHWFTVDDLQYLKRGGRIAAVTANVGTLLNIKPVLMVDDEGKLIPYSKVKGRKKAIKVLAEKLSERITNPEQQTIAISHGDCLEDALRLKTLICEKINVKEVIINMVGPVIGSHSGPGTLALFFLSESRN